MKYYSAIKKDWNCAICRAVDGPKDWCKEWSKSEREKQILYIINAYMWNLEKWYRWFYSQNRNRETDVENKHGYQQGWQEIHWEIGTDMHTLLILCIK